MKVAAFITVLYAFTAVLASEEDGNSLEKGQSPPVPEKLIADPRNDVAKKPFLRWKNPKRMERVVYAEPLNSKVIKPSNFIISRTNQFRIFLLKERNHFIKVLVAQKLLGSKISYLPSLKGKYVNHLSLLIYYHNRIFSLYGITNFWTQGKKAIKNYAQLYSQMFYWASYTAQFGGKLGHASLEDFFFSWPRFRKIIGSRRGNSGWCYKFWRERKSNVIVSKTDSPEK